MFVVSYLIFGYMCFSRRTHLGCVSRSFIIKKHASLLLYTISVVSRCRRYDTATLRYVTFRQRRMAVNWDTLNRRRLTSPAITTPSHPFQNYRLDVGESCAPEDTTTRHSQPITQQDMVTATNLGIWVMQKHLTTSFGNCNSHLDFLLLHFEAGIIGEKICFGW